MNLKLRKRSKTGPTPAAPHGQPGVARATDYTSTHQPQPGHPDMDDHADSGDKHATSPPVTPHSVAKNASRPSAVPTSGGPIRTTPPAKSLSSAHGLGTVSFSQGQPKMGSKTTSSPGGMPMSGRGEKQPGHVDGGEIQKGGMAAIRPPMPSQRGVKKKIGMPRKQSIGGMRGYIKP
jgi:hypothetical protein